MHVLPVGQDLLAPHRMTHDELREPGVIPLYDSHFPGGTHVSLPHFSPADVAPATTGGGTLAGCGVGSTALGVPGDWGVVDGEHEAVSAKSTAGTTGLRMSAG